MLRERCEIVDIEIQKEKIYIEREQIANDMMKQNIQNTAVQPNSARCAYCGNPVNPNDERCNVCGSTIRKY